jgi:hypothetical protein
LQDIAYRAMPSTLACFLRTCKHQSMAKHQSDCHVRVRNRCMSECPSRHLPTHSHAMVAPFMKCSIHYKAFARRLERLGVYRAMCVHLRPCSTWHQTLRQCTRGTAAAAIHACHHQRAGTRSCFHITMEALSPDTCTNALKRGWTPLQTSIRGNLTFGQYQRTANQRFCP